MRSRSATLLLALGLLLGLALSTAPGAEAATRRASVTAPAAITLGQQAVLRGVVRQAGHLRWVIVEQKVAGRWRGVVHATLTGRSQRRTFRAAVRPQVAGLAQYRVRIPGAKRATRWSRAVPLRVVPKPGPAPHQPNGPTDPAGPGEPPVEEPVDFYAPPAVLPSAHGTLIRTTKYVGPLASSAGADALLLYSQQGVRDTAVATSGLVSVPVGTPPAGGWPVIAWGHATTGVADACAPTRDPGGTDAATTALLQSWLDRGWAVVRTDYEGLGTPELHPYLVGSSEGRALLDAVLAARQAAPSLSRRVVVAGSDQGAHAALWADSIAATYAPDLAVEATVAFAPPSNLSSLLTRSRFSSATTRSPFQALLLRGLAVQTPSLDPQSVLGTKAASLWPRHEEQCLASLAAADAFGGVKGSELFRSTADLRAVGSAIDANAVDALTPHAPLVLLQGQKDDLVSASDTQSLARTYQWRRSDVTLKSYQNADHASVVAAGAADATAFIAAHLDQPGP